MCSAASALRVAHRVIVSRGLRAGVALLFLCTSLESATARSVRVRKGAVSEVVLLRISEPPMPGSTIRVRLPDCALSATLTTAEGERIGPGTILTTSFAVDTRRITRKRGDRVSKEVNFRPITTLPAGEYRVEIAGTALRDIKVDVDYHPQRPSKPDRQWMPFLPLQEALGVIVFSPIWVPLWVIWKRDIRGTIRGLVPAFRTPTSERLWPSPES